MALICPQCKQPIPRENIDTVKGIAVCLTCNKKYKLKMPAAQQPKPVQSVNPAPKPSEQNLTARPKNCSVCGVPLEEGDVFCMNCGAKVGEQQADGHYSNGSVAVHENANIANLRSEEKLQNKSNSNNLDHIPDAQNREILNMRKVGGRNIITSIGRIIMGIIMIAAFIIAIIFTIQRGKDSKESTIIYTIEKGATERLQDLGLSGFDIKVLNLTKSKRLGGWIGTLRIKYSNGTAESQEIHIYEDGKRILWELLE